MTTSMVDKKRAALRQHSIEGMAQIAELYPDAASEWCPHRPPLKVTRTWQIPVFFGPDSLLEAS